MTDATDSRMDLRRAVESRWTRRRRRAARRLAVEEPSFAAPLLQRLLTDGPTIRVAAAAAESLRALDDPCARAVLLEALDHPHDWVRLLAAEALAPHAEERAWRVLVASLDSDDVDMYAHAMDGIWRFGGERPLKLTERLVRERDDEPFLRELAVRTLRFEGARRSIAALETALSDSQRHVRAAAREAIDTIEARGQADGVDG